MGEGMRRRDGEGKGGDGGGEGRGGEGRGGEKVIVLCILSLR